MTERVWNPNLDELHTYIEKLEARVESLGAALVKYGAHWRNCSYMEGRCSCGFRDATLTKE